MVKFHKLQRRKRKRKLSHLIIVSCCFIFGIILCLNYGLNYKKMSSTKNNENYNNDINIKNNSEPSHNERIKAEATSVVMEKRILRNDIFVARSSGYSSDTIWENIITLGKNIMTEKMQSKGSIKDSDSENYLDDLDNNDRLVMIEVGSQSLHQCLLAAVAQFNTHCIEPSPTSFTNIAFRVSKRIKGLPWLQKYIYLHNVAAGSESGKMLDFSSSGSTGDHVGDFDMWNMKPVTTTDKDSTEKSANIVQVPSMKMDDLIVYNKVKPYDLNAAQNLPATTAPKIDEVFALKVDTQGFEPSVFSGLTESLNQGKIRYILTEYWPKGMDLMNKSSNKCEISVGMLNKILDAGYKLYALPISVHPHVYRGDNEEMRRKKKRVIRDWKLRPLNDLKADCMYIRDELEKLYPSGEGYHMGYWTDILAVAPGADVNELLLKEKY
mmetsp:Transcript_24828/g.28699  ORF Transcript_24828/g.28699 Transcript_24828/m.28699 type:complete len:438 (+) Transcript_24828:69-1382(+)